MLHSHGFNLYLVLSAEVIATLGIFLNSLSYEFRLVHYVSFYTYLTRLQTGWSVHPWWNLSDPQSCP
jgi:hypothetical protein